MHGETTHPQTIFSSHRPGDRLVLAGSGIFTTGLLATLVVVSPLFLGSEPMPMFAYLVAALATPTGLALAIAGTLRGNRARRGTPPT